MKQYINLKKAGMIWIFVVIGFIGMKQYQEKMLAESLSHKILRFHVLANSDTKEDQKLKLKVRDAIGSYMQQELKEIDNMEESKRIVLKSIEKIQKTAEDVIKGEGYDYAVEVSLAKADFPRKTYGNYCFPKGEYQALQVIIGEGKGKNWWCVMYPNMCFQGSMYEVVEKKAEKELKRVLSNEEYEAVMESEKYEISFKWFPFFCFWKR